LNRFDMTSSGNWKMLAARGWRFADRVAIVVLLLFRSRPGFWRMVARMIGERDYVITVATPMGPARLVFNPLETSELTVVDELLPGDIYAAKSRAGHFLDCGAFRGISAIYLQDQVKATHVTAYEPQIDNFEILSRRLAKYLPDATCLNAAVGSLNGGVLFSGSGVGGSVSAEGNRIRLLRLRDEVPACDRAGLLLKMDIEGAEREVLPDLLPALPQECSFFLETHFPEEPTKALVDLCREAGFVARECRRREEDGSDVLFIDWELQRS
jgi:FkbM family methyltransferase